MNFKFSQWTTPDGIHYLPAGEVQKTLPPGYYEMERSMQGIYFKRKPTKTESLIRFPDSNSDAIIEEIEKFWDMEDKFRESDIPYKRGIMMYGPPGSGKTCTLRLIVKNLVESRNGVVFDFPGVNLLKDGYEILRQIHPDTPVIFLMEDIDALLRRYDESEILNLLDGMYGIDRTVFVATTNHPEKLGSRIMNRPSRFDKRFFIDMPNEEARRMYIKSKLIGESDDVVNKWVNDTGGFSIAHLKELYVATKILGDDYNRAVSVLKTMKDAIDSREFDDYHNAKEQIYSECGTGKVYREWRDKVGKTPNNIASIISENVRHSNGLI